MTDFKRGVVVAAHPIAAKAGVSVLKKGGNAVDAAVATALTLDTVIPAFCGIGGGGFALIWLANEGKAFFVDYRERAPNATRENMFKVNAEGKVTRKENSIGYKAVAVPGTLAGDSLIVEKFGTSSLRDLLSPAIHYAARGFRVSQALADVWKHSVSKLTSFRASRSVYLKRGRPYRQGDEITLKDLASSLRSIAKNGPSEFYTGRTANSIAEDMKSNRGLLSNMDLERFEPTIREPLRGPYKDLEIISAPPPSSGGTIILQALNMLEDSALRKFGHNSVRALHLTAEVLTRAFANTRPRVCDPDFSQIPVKALISKDFAKSLASSIKSDAASGILQPSSLSPETRSSTTHLSVIDREGNAVALTESVECYFGSGVVVPGTGILLNDTMHDFDPRPGYLNSVSPWKIPMSSMSPTIVMKDGKPLLVVGSAGSTRIVSSTFQVIFNLAEFGMTVKGAVQAPRIHTEGDLVQVERGIAQKTVEELRKMGHRVEVRRSKELYFGGVHAAFAEPHGGGFDGGADPRRDGAVLGY